MKQYYIAILTLVLSINAFSQETPYYNPILSELSSETGMTLFATLAAHTANEHSNNLSYSNIWEACKVTDEDPNNSSNVVLIYGWESGSDGDVTNDLSRSKNDNGGSNGDWNREHTFANSLASPDLDDMGTNGAPYSDAHNLRPSDVQRNGSRGNRQFATGSGNSTQTGAYWYPGDASTGGTDWRGDVARITMYMYLRYGTQCRPSYNASGTTNSVDSNMIDLLLEWNAADPVSAYEDARNAYHDTNGTYAQGNRNPFIDQPYLATLIWGGTPAEDRWGTAVPDTEDPTNPSNLSVSNETNTTIDLDWTVSTDNVAVTEYDIYVGGVYNSSSATNSHTVTGLTASTTYSFTVLAKDAAGNTSGQSSAVNGTTTAPDTTDPTVPTNLSVSNETSTTIDLDWTASTDNIGVTGYDIYVGGVYNSSSATNSHTVTDLSPETTYSFTVLAKDAATNESAQSSAVNGTTIAATAGASELFFSEYMEGSGNNKALEITNNTGGNIDLSIYTIKKSVNGSSSWDSQVYSFPASAEITDGDVYVVANNSIAVCSSEVDDSTTSSVLQFNGDDPVGLFKNDVLIDIIGTLGIDTDFAKETTIVRNDDVSEPNTTYTPSEWTSFSQNTCSDLGSHSFVLNVEENSFLSEISIYPNPTKGDLLNIDTQENLSLEVYNILGKRMLTVEVSNSDNIVDVSDLQTGIYFIKLSSETGAITKKFIKQ